MIASSSIAPISSHNNSYIVSSDLHLSLSLSCRPPSNFAVLVIITLSTAFFPRSLARDEQAVRFHWKDREAVILRLCIFIVDYIHLIKVEAASIKSIHFRLLLNS